METEELKQEEPTEESKKEVTGESTTTQDATQPSVTDMLIERMVNLCERQSETIVNLNNRLNQLEEKHNSLNEEYQNGKPLEIKAEVMGMYDFSKNKEIMYKQSYNDEKNYARNLMDKLQSLYPNA